MLEAFHDKGYELLGKSIVVVFFDSAVLAAWAESAMGSQRWLHIVVMLHTEPGEELRQNVGWYCSW